MKTIIITLGLALAIVGSVLYVAQLQYHPQDKKIANLSSTPTPIQEVAADTTQSTIGPTTTSFIPTSTPIPPTSIPSPTIIPTVTVDNSPKIAAIQNLTKEFGSLNATIQFENTEIQKIMNDSSCINTINNSTTIYTPSQQSSLISQCNSSKNSLIAIHNSKINVAKLKITQINDQIQQIISTCSGTECSDIYRNLTNALESQGYIVR